MELFDDALQRLRSGVGNFTMLSQQYTGGGGDYSVFTLRPPQLLDADALDVAFVVASLVVAAALCLFGFNGVAGMPRGEQDTAAAAAAAAAAAGGPLTTFAHQPGKENQAIVDQLRTKVGDYVPPEGWYNPHVGTTVALGRDLAMQYERQVLDDEAVIDWYPRRPPPSNGSPGKAIKVVLVFPGLGLMSTSKFIKKFVHTLVRQLDDEDLYAAVVLTRGVGCPPPSSRKKRGGGGGRGGTCKLWHPAMTDDAERCIRFIYETAAACAPSGGGRQKPPRLFLAGFSAGSNLVKTLLRNSAARARYPVHAAMCCACNNASYRQSRDALERTLLGKVYSRLICNIYKDIVLADDALGTVLGRERLADLRGLSLLSDYDEFAWRFLHKGQFPTIDHYYAALSGGGGDIFRCDVPMLILQPADDPLHAGRVREHLRPEEFVAANRRGVYMETRHGNHFGYYEEDLTKALSSDKTYTYPPRVAAVFFEQVTRELE